MISSLVGSVCKSSSVGGLTVSTNELMSHVCSMLVTVEIIISYVVTVTEISSERSIRVLILLSCESNRE